MSLGPITLIFAAALALPAGAKSQAEPRRVETPAGPRVSFAILRSLPEREAKPAKLKVSLTTSPSRPPGRD